MERLRRLMEDEGDLRAACDFAAELGEAAGAKALMPVRRLLAEMHVEELVEMGRVADALAFVRTEAASIARTSPDSGPAWLRQLVTNGLLRKPVSGDARDSQRRKRRSERVMEAMPLDCTPAPARLATLVEQALLAQIDKAELHNIARPQLSLLRDYSPSVPDQLPQRVAQVLFDHEDEVWHVAFSHDGSMLASASRDGTAVVWSVSRVGDGCSATRRQTLRDESGPVAYLAWSPDDSMLACCSQDATVRLWGVASGRCVRVLRHHSEPVTAAVWLPAGDALLTAGHDEKLCLVDLHGAVQRSWSIPRVQDVVVGAGGAWALATSWEKRIAVVDVRGGAGGAADPGDEKGAAASGAGGQDPADPRRSPRAEDRWKGRCIQEQEPVVAMCTSADGRYLLANLADSSMRLYDLGTQHEDSINVNVCPRVHYAAPSHARRQFVVRCCMGGVGDRFVACGSESGKIYIYQRDTGRVVLTLAGHTSTVNAVAWNPKDPGMLASACDDKTVIVWLPKIKDPESHDSASGFSGATVAPGS